MKTLLSNLQWNSKLVLAFPIFLLFFVLSFFRVAGSIPLVLMVLSFIVSFIFIFKNPKIKFPKDSKKYLILLLFYFLIGCISLIFSENIDATVSKLTLRASIIILPFLIMSFVRHFNLNYKTLLKTSILGNVVSLVFIIANAISKYSEKGSNAFFYSELFSDFLINPIIYSSLLNLNILFTFYILKTDSIKHFIFKYLIIGFLSFGVILSSSKIGIIILLINLFYILIVEAKRNFKQTFFLIITVSILISLGFYFTIDRGLFFKRFQTISYYLEKRETPNMNQRFPRTIIWECSQKLIRDNFLIGVGIANTNKELHDEYVKIKFGKGMKYHFNAHNQFIETFLGTGVFGFLILVLIFAYLFKTALKNKDKLFFHTLTVLFLYCLIESYFESQMGLYIFCMYSCLFLVRNLSISFHKSPTT